MAQDNPNVLTTGNLDQGGPIDRTAAGIQYQHYQLGLKATGAALGIGRRSVPDPAAQFSLSGGQFSGGHAKSTYSEAESEIPE